MVRTWWQTIEAQISGQAAARMVAEVARFHRIQASPGFRRAAEMVCEKLQHAGVQARILSFPADRETSFWGASSFQEWDAREATLHLLQADGGMRKLADYRDLPLSLISRSLSFDGQAEVVVLEKGEEAAEYEGVDVRGKVVLAQGTVQRVHEMAVERRGALGIIYDGMAELEHVRPPWSLPDATQYTSFWWQARTPAGFGFALSPRQGLELRRLAKEQTLRVQAHVDARLYDGAIEVVEAVIPGKTDEEVVLVAHLCHPQPSANDNGSGVAALIEVACALQALIERRRLAPPRRTIRLLWLPEMTGSFAYLAAHEERIPRMVAGLNLDMVGQDQEQCGSSLLFEQPPHAFSNFTAALLAHLRDRILSQAHSFGGVGGYPLFRHAEVPFGGGSDHYIFSDPSVGVPMPMIIQWPDRFYHTSADTPDRVDPQMMGRVGTLTAMYAYWLAQAGRTEARWLAREMQARFRCEAISIAQEAVTRAAEGEAVSRQALRAQLDYRAARQVEALGRLRCLARLDPSTWQAEARAVVAEEWDRVAGLLPDEPAEETVAGGGNWVPRRRFRGPLQAEAVLARLDAAARDEWYALAKGAGESSGGRVLPVLALYWADGKRSVGEIAALLKQECGVDAGEFLARYFGKLVELGLLDVRQKKA